MHRVTGEADGRTRRELGRLGLSFDVLDAKGVMRDRFVFDIAESDPLWKDVQSWMSRRRHTDLVSPAFSEDEVSAAPWVELIPDWHHGYPQPVDDFGYLDATYDLSAYCRACGIGAIQKAPFRLTREPAWGRRGIFQINWVFDEFFVTPPVWAAVFQPHGVACRSVVDKRGADLQTVVQLDIVDAVGIRSEGLDEEACPVCQRLKYAPIKRGPLPELVEEPRHHLAKTKESFGSGASAHHAIVLSQALRGALVSAGVRGASARPVAPIEQS